MTRVQLIPWDELTTESKEMLEVGIASRVEVT
jgi:hypothetical protein